jgi:hypothetical protein
MSKRAVAGFLWFLSIWVAYEVIWSITGAPRPIGPILGLVAASLVVIDPTGRFWGKPMTATAPRLVASRVEG